MARSRKVIKKRAVATDPIFANKQVSRFINRIMKDGKKTVAQSVVYDAFEIIKEKGQDPLKVFENAITNVGPRMEVRPRRVGGASYQVPTEVRGDRRVALAIRWILQAATARSNKEFHSTAAKIAAELLDIQQGLGDAIRKRNSVQKMADANRAFSHLRW